MAWEDEDREGKGAAPAVKGSVRPLADSISVESAERAAKQVREAIDKQQLQLNDLKRFSDENKSLSELVLELPDSVSHRIMVPFGKAAFFPGRLIHTNEFLVLLGESHYAERSAKQTVEILNRRSEFLDGKIAIAKAHIADLETESSFVMNTAEEARAGLVEIREEYMGSRELQNNPVSNSSITATAASSQPDAVLKAGRASDLIASTSSSSSLTNEDREHDRLMARLSELEVAEVIAGDGHDDDNEGSEGEIFNDSNAGIPMPFRSDLHRNVVSKKEHDLVEDDYDSEATEEEGSQAGDSEDEEEDYDEEDDQRSSEEEISTEAGHGGSHDHAWDLGEKQTVESVRGKPLSRFAKEVYSGKGALNSQPTHRKVTFQQEQPTERLTVDQISGKKVETKEVMPGFNYLQKELQEWRRDRENRKERQGDKTFIDGSMKEEHSRVQTSGEASTVQQKLWPAKPPAPVCSTMPIKTSPVNQAFTGKVTEHSFIDPTSSIDQQVQEESQPSRPMSKFKMRQAQQAGRR